MTAKVFTFPNDVLYTHSRVELENGELQPNGGYTIGYYIDHEQDKLYGAISICSDKDLFSKEIGREYTLERLTRRREGKAVHDASGLPLAVVFDTDDLCRWANVEVNKNMERLFTSSCNAIYKQNGIQYQDVEMPKAKIGEYNVGLLIDKLTDYFATFHGKHDRA